MPTSAPVVPRRERHGHVVSSSPLSARPWRRIQNSIQVTTTTAATARDPFERRLELERQPTDGRHDGHADGDGQADRQRDTHQDPGQHVPPTRPSPRRHR